MTHLKRIAFIGNSLPRHCGIATFTTHLHQAVATAYPEVATHIIAMTDNENSYDYPPSVVLDIEDSCIDDYVRAAHFLNEGKYDVVCLQHEFGIFGGEAGSYILSLLSRLTMPVITTLHTVLSSPNQSQRDVLLRIIEASAKVIVMAEKGRDLLYTVYGAAKDKIDMIPHGIPDVAFAMPDVEKQIHGYAGKKIILTFGLLTPNKGIETMIDAMPAILCHSPETVYIVLGATHPNLVRHEGETYRNSLIARAEDLGVSTNIIFMDQFVDQATLLGFISMCDVYVTPYLTEAQMTSGTLAYSFGSGKPVVSTPYWHASELLANKLGLLVPFGDSDAFGKSIVELLTNDDYRLNMSRQAYDHSRSMTWARTAERYVGVFEAAGQKQRIRLISRTMATHVPREQAALPDRRPDIQLGHFYAMCDDTGLFQHAVHSVPDRTHGYCIDDNARALLVACALSQKGETPLPEKYPDSFTSFIQHAWNPDTSRFRNFMSFDRRWLEDRGSDDSHGRTLWALGTCAYTPKFSHRQVWAADLFAQGLPVVELMHSPRTWAFALLGLDGYCAARPNDTYAQQMRILLANRLLALLADVEMADWHWFEDCLAYDNARLCQALIVTGIATKMPDYTEAGLRTLRWLMAVQTSESGFFRPVGSASFGDKRQKPKPFDQQPLEASASISACLVATALEKDGLWRHYIARAYSWFHGSNDLLVPLVDPVRGSCRDGLHPDRVNENQGGESVVSYLLSTIEIRQMMLHEVTNIQPLEKVA
jgi:glycosyltransferase involved in cell wall biosynthesis